MTKPQIRFTKTQVSPNIAIYRLKPGGIEALWANAYEMLDKRKATQANGEDMSEVVDTVSGITNEQYNAAEQLYNSLSACPTADPGEVEAAKAERDRLRALVMNKLLGEGTCLISAMINGDMDN